ncbi:MAG: AIR synthase-related protein, partial [Ignavibacteriaceae bacterium]|nr:AIR synthase-related protein [Ignavibacteriaceae bacterium]
IFILGEDFEELGGSEYLKVVHETVAGDSPQLNLDTEKQLHERLLFLIRNKLIQSAHDISEGGIVSALVECSILNRKKMIGAKVIIPVKTRSDFSLFSESQSRVIVSVKKSDRAAFEYYMLRQKAPYRFLGMTGGKQVKINDEITLPLSKLENIYYNTLSQIMGS